MIIIISFPSYSISNMLAGDMVSELKNQGISRQGTTDFFCKEDSKPCASRVKANNHHNINADIYIVLGKFQYWGFCLSILLITQV